MTQAMPSPERLRLARLWWADLPSPIKANQSIWTILAMYAEFVIQTETVCFAADTEADAPKSKAETRAEKTSEP